MGQPRRSRIVLWNKAQTLCSTVHLGDERLVRLHSRGPGSVCEHETDCNVSLWLVYLLT
jgi:hypothetical protein